MKPRLIVGLFLGCLTAGGAARPGEAPEPMPPKDLVALTAEAESALADLQMRYLENNPKLQEQIERVRELRRLKSAGSREPLVLQLARVDLAVMQVHFLSEHPLLKEQAESVSAMERQWRADAGTPEVLLEALGQLAAMRVHYGEQHPRMRELAEQIAALEAKAATRP